MNKYLYLRRNCLTIREFDLSKAEVLAYLTRAIEESDGMKKKYYTLLQGYILSPHATLQQIASESKTDDCVIKREFRECCRSLDVLISNDKRSNVYQESICSLPLSTAVMNALLRGGVRTLPQLDGKINDGSIVHIVGIGDKSIIKNKRSIEML